MIAAGIGSMPGGDYAESVRVVAGETPDLVALPELPARGIESSMIGRTLGIVEALGADIVPAGWRLTDNPGVDQRRARSLLAHDLDIVEEHLQDFEEAVKLQVAGPWTLAAAVELPRGERVLADHGARRELAEALAEGITGHLADVLRRVGGARDIVVQVDEPSLDTVLAGGVRTASGLHRYRTIEPPEADAALRRVVDAVSGAGARPAVHSCSARVPVEALRDAGFEAISFDLGRVRPEDAWAEAFESDVDLWVGVVNPMDDDARSVDRDAERVLAFFSRLGFGDASLRDRLVITPGCGLAGASPQGAAAALRHASRVASALG